MKRLLMGWASVVTLLSAMIDCRLPCAGAAEGPTLVLDTGGHTAAVHALAFTPDGNQLVSVSKDKTIRIWDVVQGAPLHTLRFPASEGARGELYAAALSPDGQRLAVGGNDLAVYIVNLSQGQIERRLEGNKAAVLGLAFSSDGTLVASAGGDSIARVWNVSDGSNLHELRGHKGPLRSVCFSPAGDRLATASDDGTARIWKLTGNGGQALSLKASQKTISSVHWSPSGEMLATAGDDGTLRIWSPTGQQLKQFDNLGKIVNTAIFTPDSREILFTWRNDTGNEAGAGFINVQSGDVRVRFRESYNFLLCGAISRDGQLAATAGFNPEDVRVWRTSTAEQLFQLQGRGDTKWSVAWSRDGKSIAWGNEPYHDGVRVPQLTEKGPLQAAFDVTKLDLAKADDSYPRGGQAPAGIKLDDLGNGLMAVKQNDRNLATLDAKPHGRLLRSAALFDDRQALVGFNAEPVALVDFRSGTLVRHFVGHTGAVWGIAVSPDSRYFATASHDQSVKIWRVDSSQPLLSFHFTEPEWIAWTPEGYYAASPGGEKLIGWLVDNGPDQLATYHPIERFRETFYRPDVIRNLLQAGSVDAALGQAAGKAGRTEKKVGIDQVLPPRVVITSPAHSGAHVGSGQFEVKVAASAVGGRPITSFSLLVDGRPYGGDESLRKLPQPRTGTVNESWKVDLPPGSHRLTVFASSQASQGSSEEIEVVVGPTSAASKSSAANLHVLAVGINDYPGRLKLDCAAPDAQAIDECFRRQSRGLYQVQTTLLINRQATKRAIKQALDDLTRKVKADDVAIVFYAGHGDCKLADEFFLLPVDTDVNALAETGISGVELRARLARLPCVALLIMDCCYAGSIDAGSKKKRALPAEAGDLVRDMVSDDHGLVVMCGASKEQVAREESQNGHGFFTQALIEGLQGKAASRRDGLVYLSGLQNYVEDRVRELSFDEQYPTIGKPSLIRSFPLAKPAR